MKPETIEEIGDMRHRCTFYHRIEIPDDSGGAVFGKGAIYSEEMWCGFEAEPYVQTLKRAGHIEGTRYGTLTVHYDSQITNDMIVDFDSYLWKIETMEKIGFIDFFWKIKIKSFESDRS